MTKQSKPARSAKRPTRPPARKPRLKKTLGARPLDRNRELIGNATGYTGSRRTGRSATSAIP